LIVESTMSFHCMPLLRPPMFIEVDMGSSQLCI
jgi:hypothetical protein